MIDPTTADALNGAFELAGSGFCAANVWRIWVDKMVRGVYWPSVGFFAFWGWWNLIYYPSLGQWYSFLAGALLALINTIWVIQLIYYTRKEKLDILRAKVKLNKSIETI